MKNAMGGLVFLALGLAFAFFAVVSANNTRAFLATALQAQGTVVDFKESWSRDEDGNDTVSYFPIVTFTALRTARQGSLEYHIDEGRKVTFTAGVGSGEKAYGIGGTVAVNYQPDNPEDARLHSFTENWLLAVILGGFGLVFGGAGVAIMCGKVR